MVPDDTLYTNDWVVANRITKSIGTYCSEKLGLPEGEPYNLYKKHGTCLRGLEKEGIKHDRGRTQQHCSRGAAFDTDGAVWQRTSCARCTTSR